MSQRIQLEIITYEVNSDTREWYNIELRISNQTERREKFGTNGMFMASNGFRLESVNCPEWRPREQKLFVKGLDFGLDNQTFIIETYVQWTSLTEAIDEFNLYFEGNDTYKNKKCRGTCGVIMCKECLNNVKSLLTFSYTSNYD